MINIYSVKRLTGRREAWEHDDDVDDDDDGRRMSNESKIVFWCVCVCVRLLNCDQLFCFEEGACFDLTFLDGEDFSIVEGDDG